MKQNIIEYCMDKQYLPLFHILLKLRLQFNPLQSGVAFLYPLKTLENLTGYRKVTPGCNGLKFQQ